MSPATNDLRKTEAATEVDENDRRQARITSCQRPLFAYIRTLIGPEGDVDDVLQEVNLVLWRKRDEFDGGERFLAWACHVAYLQVLAHNKRRRRDRSAYFDEEVLGNIADCLAEEFEQIDARVEALRSCLVAKLPAEQRRVILRRYEGNGSVLRMAGELGRPVGSLKVSLYRIRQLLAGCIARAHGEEDRG